MDSHDLLLQHVIERGWRTTKYNPPTTPLSGYLQAVKCEGKRITRVTWIIEKTDGALRCSHPNYTVHFRHH